MQKQEREPMKLVYICSPLRGDIERNIRRAIRFSRFAAWEGVVPLAPHAIFTQFLDDTDKDERALGLLLGLDLLKRCDELWCFGDQISEGMKGELQQAEILGIPIIYFSDRCERLVVS